MRLITTLPEVYESITRPVAIGVANHLKTILNLPAETRLLIPGASEDIAMPGSTIADHQAQNYFKYDGRFLIEVTDDFTEDPSWARAVNKDDAQPIFIDKALGVMLSPSYVNSQLTFNCTYRAPSRTMAERFRDDIRMRSGMLRQEHLHEATYHYGFPSYYIELLKEIHRMREAVAPYNEDFLTWIKNNITERATTLTTLIGTEPRLVIPESQICVQGWFDFADRIEAPEKGSEAGDFIFRFQYKTEYDRPAYMTMLYPLVIHNQLLAERYRSEPNPNGEIIDPSRRLKRPSRSRESLNHFSTAYPSICYDGLSEIRMPVFDDWSPEMVTPGTSTLYTVMLAVEPTNPTYLMELTDLDDYEIDPSIVEFMRTEGDFMSQYLNSIIYVQLYENELPVGDAEVNIDANLVARCTRALDQRKRYHLRVSLMTDINSLSSGAIERLSRSGEGGLKILTAIMHRYFNTARLPRLLGGRVIPRQFIKELGLAITSYKRQHTTDFAHQMLTVGTFLIRTHRIDDYAQNARATDDAGDSTDTDSASPVRPDLTDGVAYPVPGCPS